MGALMKFCQFCPAKIIYIAVQICKLAETSVVCGNLKIEFLKNNYF